MNKVQVTLTEVNELTREVLGEHVVVIDVDDYGRHDVSEFFQENLQEIRKAAAKAVASRSVDYDSFGSDSEYLDRLDRVADTMYLADACVPGVVTRTYTMEGLYSEGSPWSDDEVACCFSEAEFRALWTMSVNDGFSLEAAIRQSVSADDAVVGLLGYMEEQELTGMCNVARPKIEDAQALLRDLLHLAIDGSPDDLRVAVLARGGDMLARLSEDVSDEIVELPEAGEVASLKA
ncbi:hypothetical protein G6L37_02080 [Agrobacterium rubi]|nr:hypothetical protein [Agrobacterium rubi]NTF24182.1 hypothetical protein [Agrobacterium rubi]